MLVRGGLSGPAVKPVALKAVHDIYRTVGVPILGGGGVTSGVDVAEFMLAGATVVQVGTASFVRDPAEILAEFTDFLRDCGMDAGELTGALI